MRLNEKNNDISFQSDHAKHSGIPKRLQTAEMEGEVIQNVFFCENNKIK